MKHITFISILIYAFLLNGCRTKINTDEQGIFLRVQLEEGTSFTTKISYAQNMELDYEGLFSILEQDIELWVHSTVLNDSSDQYTISNKYDRIQLTQSLSNEEEEEMISIDTKDDVSEYESELEKYYYQLIREPYLIILNQNSEETYSELDKKSQKIGGGKFSSPFQKALEFHPFFPDYLLEEKDTWHKEISIINKELSITGSTKYQLEKWDSTHAYISMKSQLSGRSNTFREEEVMDIEKTGQLVIDRATGLIFKAVIDQKLQWLGKSVQKQKLLSTIKIASTIKK